MSKMSNLQIMIEDIKADICDNKCKFPEQYALEYEDSEEAHEQMLRDECEFCPLSNWEIK